MAEEPEPITCGTRVDAFVGGARKKKSSSKRKKSPKRKKSSKKKKKSVKKRNSSSVYIGIKAPTHFEQLQQAHRATPDDRLNDPRLSALCMSCFHRSGKQIKSRIMSPNGRTISKNSRGRSMIRGLCSVCSGRMTVFV